MSELFNIELETDLTEFSSLVNSGDLDWVSGGLASTAGKMGVTIDDTSDRHGVKTFTQITADDFGARFHFKRNTLSIPNYNSFRLCYVKNGYGDYNMTVEIYKTSTVYQIRAGLRNDSYGADFTSWYTIDDTEHCIEVLCQRASSAVANDAEITLWIDDVEKENKTGLDWYNFSKPASLEIGAVDNVDASTTGQFFIDEIVLRDDAFYIGPAVTGHAGSQVSGPRLKSKIFGGLI